MCMYSLQHKTEKYTETNKRKGFNHDISYLTNSLSIVRQWFVNSSMVRQRFVNSSIVRQFVNGSSIVRQWFVNSSIVRQ